MPTVKVVTLHATKNKVVCTRLSESDDWVYFSARHYKGIGNAKAAALEWLEEQKDKDIKKNILKSLRKTSQRLR